MILTNLKLKNFRNYSISEVDFSSGLNMIYGENASGKTNLVESVYFLSSGRSFRTNIVSELIKNDENIGTIEGKIIRGKNSHKIRAVIEKEKRHFFLNGREIKKVSELAKMLNVLVFTPTDVHFFKESPRVRRNYLDINLGKMFPAYLEALTRYNKLLQERNELLKKKVIDDIQKDTIEEMMCEESYTIYRYRKEFIKKLEPIVEKVVKAIHGDAKRIHLTYLFEIDEEDKGTYVCELKKALNRALESDLKYRATSIGIHREDFVTELNGRKIAAFGSQGEKRMTALALKVAPYFLIEERENKPIIVLDDVMSELDEEHIRKLLAFFSKFEQVFITGTKIEKSDASFYEVSKQNIRRVDYGR